MIKPNADRVLVEGVNYESLQKQSIIQSHMPGQVVAGEKLFIGRVVDPGTSDFKEGQFIYYSEFSAASVTDMREVLLGNQSVSEATTAKDNKFFIVSEDDIMGYEPYDADLDALYVKAKETAEKK